MTKKEFLAYRNPQDKYHPSSAYDFDLMTLNRERSVSLGSDGMYGAEEIEGFKYPYGIKLVQEGKPIAVIFGGVAYYDDSKWARQLPRQMFEGGGVNSKTHDLPFTSTKRVKYLSELLPEIHPTGKLNAAEYPVVLQHIIVSGEPMTIRAESQPTRNKGVSMVILNQDGYKVAAAQNEWGTTLLMVAQEYRSKGLGKIIGKLWYEYNPNIDSGGFTSGGERNAIELWKDRVREFLANGWYSELVRQRRMTSAEVDAILRDVGQRFKREPVQEALKASGDLLVACDGISFVLYDRAFLQEQSDRFILGFGFLRDAAAIGTFVFRLEYERKYAALATKIILQMARDNGERLYDGEGYHDLLENVDAIPGVDRDGDYLEVTRDLVPLKQWSRIEKATRGKADPYQEIYNSLVEQAETKWN